MKGSHVTQVDTLNTKIVIPNHQIYVLFQWNTCNNIQCGF